MDTSSEVGSPTTVAGERSIPPIALQVLRMTLGLNEGMLGNCLGRPDSGV